SGATSLTAAHLRRAILEALAIDDGLRQTLLTAPYGDPLAHHLAKYVRGFMLPAGDALSAPGKPYPEIHWTMTFKDGIPDTPGMTAVAVEDNVTPILADGARVTNLRIEAWAQRGIGDGGTIRADPVEWKVSRPPSPDSA